MCANADGAIQKALISAAGGNATALQVLPSPIRREEYESRGNALLREFSGLGAEQAGFYIAKLHRLEMAGGEFCGNASRAAAVLDFLLTGSPRQTLEVSGYDGPVDSIVSSQGERQYHARCAFLSMSVSPIHRVRPNGDNVTIVDLGGIVHVILHDEFPSSDDAYRRVHREIVDEFQLQNRDSVGVVWVNTKNGVPRIEPIVWVRAVDSFYRETSCGSATIAVSVVSGSEAVLQPSGGTIHVSVGSGGLTIDSDMEVLMCTSKG